MLLLELFFKFDNYHFVGAALSCVGTKIAPPFICLAASVSLVQVISQLIILRTPLRFVIVSIFTWKNLSFDLQSIYIVSCDDVMLVLSVIDV